MSTAEKKMKIFVGQPRPSDALLGRLENDNSSIKGFAEPCNAIGGMQIIANRSIVWGIRLTKDGAVPKERLAYNDKAYTGKVKFVKWGTDGGIPITIRYKSGVDTIDYDYQVMQLGMKKFGEEVDDDYIHIPFGENVIFDSEEQKQIFLQHHHENIDSICRNPDVINGSLRMVKSFESAKEQIKNIDKGWEAMKIVREAMSFEDLLVLKHIIGDHTVIKYDESDENSLFENITLWVNQNAGKFLELVKAYEVRVSDVIEKFRSYKAYDWTNNGRLMGGLDKKELLLDGIDAKGEDMVQYLFDFRMKHEVFEAINNMIIIAQKFK